MAPGPSGIPAGSGPEGAPGEGAQRRRSTAPALRKPARKKEMFTYFGKTKRKVFVWAVNSFESVIKSN